MTKKKDKRNLFSDLKDFYDLVFQTSDYKDSYRQRYYEDIEQMQIKQLEQKIMKNREVRENAELDQIEEVMRTGEKLDNDDVQVLAKNLTQEKSSKLYERYQRDADKRAQEASPQLEEIDAEAELGLEPYLIERLDGPKP